MSIAIPFFIHIHNMKIIQFSFSYFLVTLGDGGVGKSCLMNRFVSNHFDENSFHTIGVEFLNKDIDIDGERYTLQVSNLGSFHFNSTVYC